MKRIILAFILLPLLLLTSCAGEGYPRVELVPDVRLLTEQQLYDRINLHLRYAEETNTISKSIYSSNLALVYQNELIIRELRE